MKHIRIDSKTIIQVEEGQDEEEAVRKFRDRVKVSRMTTLRPTVPQMIKEQ